MRKIMPFLTIVAVLVFISSAGAVMGGGSMMPGTGGSGTPGIGSMMGGGFSMTNTGGFGMMNGMAAAPVVGSDGTAYLVSYNPAANSGAVPSSSDFESTITSVTASGVINTITLKGIISKPVIYGNVLAATSSLPDFSNFYISENLGTAAPAGQSTAYLINLPLTSSSVPVGVSLDGQYASTPVIANDNIYVVTSDFGNAMMPGNSTFNTMYGNYNFNNTGNAKSYLYIIGFDGSLVNKITLQ